MNKSDCSTYEYYKLELTDSSKDINLARKREGKQSNISTGYTISLGLHKNRRDNLKRFFAVLIVFSICFLSCSCVKTDDSMEHMMQLRENLLRSNYSFCVNVSADYGEQLHTFGMKCKSADHGTMIFEVTSPESIAGITGTIDAQTANITFDGHVLAFEPLTDKQIAPISAPWILMNGLKSGYIHGCSGNEQPQVLLEDSYEDESLQLQVWLSDENKPVSAEIYWKERRVIAMEILDFSIA